MLEHDALMLLREVNRGHPITAFIPFYGSITQTTRSMRYKPWSLMLMLPFPPPTTSRSRRRGRRCHGVALPHRVVDRWLHAACISHHSAIHLP